MIQIQQLTRNFGHKTAVDCLSLTVQTGEICGFLGPNGAGKTTTIRMMVGLLRPTSGTVLFGPPEQTLDIQRDSLAARRRLGYIPDAPFLYEKLTGREHLHFVGEVYQVPTGQLHEETEHYLSLFGLQSAADQPIEGYSHGMRQKVVMAAALLHHPDYLIIDEPMVGLDPRSARLVKDLFLKLARESGTTLFLSTHSLDLAEEVCDRIGILFNGKLVALGTNEELRDLVKGKESRLEEIFLELTREEDGIVRA
jgi:ABC-2 type transport system ATP-binding protein